MPTINSWLDMVPGFLETLSQIQQPYYPATEDVFRAFSFFSPPACNVVILGQDPYHTEGKASGLAFGYNQRYTGPVNSSLSNILAEVKRTEGEEMNDTSLEGWARQGVLLLNTRLTVAPGKPMSHAGKGWENNVREILFLLAHGDTLPRVFMLWGREAQLLFASAVGDEATTRKLVLRASHPCEYSAHISFTKCGHFRDANTFLLLSGEDSIDWTGGDS